MKLCPFSLSNSNLSLLWYIQIKKRHMQRRDFIKSGAMAISALPLYGSTFLNLPKRIAIIGTGWWGMNILNEAMAAGNCTIVGVCDVDENALNAAWQTVKKVKGDDPKKYKDYRDMIAKEKPEIVIVATPDHWHALNAIEAIKAGAHVFMEKPIGHTLNEGKAILRAARKYGRKVQVDTHRRLSPHNISAMEFLKSGKAGKITQVKAFVNYAQPVGSIIPDSEAPAHIDWNMWVGPAPYKAYNTSIHPKGFRYHSDYANGLLGDWGIHWFDQILWWTEEKWPKTVFSTGGKFIKQDNSDVPDQQLVSFAFEDFDLTWEHKLCATNNNEKHNVGCYFYGTEGTFHLGWLDGWTFYPRKKDQEIIHQDAQLHQPDQQNIKEAWADFLQSIESDKLPACDIEKGFRATNLSMLGMISQNLGRSVQWDGEKNVIIGDELANGMLSRKYRDGWEYPTGE